MNEENEMNGTEKLSPEDPRLTAYALGEMDATERAAFERLLEGDTVARASVEDIRATVAALGAALQEEAGETKPEIDARHVPVRAGAMPAESGRRRRESTLLTFPRLYYMAAGLAAACFAVVYVVDNRRDSRAREAMAQAKPVVVHEVAGGGTVTAAPAAEGDAAASRASDPRPADEVGMFALVPAETRVPDRFFASAELTTSTFPLRLGRASYARVREELRRGRRPAKEMVHVAELINAFHYTWPDAAPGEAFATLLEETAAPWAAEHRLVRVGLRGLGAGEIARAAHVEVEFNPARVRAWRLIGFERDGEVLGVSGGSFGETMRGGETVTALYEVVPALAAAGADADRTMLRVELHYVDVASGERRTLARRLQASEAGFARASADLKFIAAVAAFGLALRDSPHQPSTDMAEITRWAEAGASADPQRLEFVQLMQRAGLNH